MIFPFVDSKVEILSKEELPIFKEVAWDYQLDTPLLDQGELVIIEGVEALKVWIYKVIKTTRFEHEIYSWDYGCEINTLIGKGFSKALIVSEVKRYVREALMINEYIESINSIDVKLEDDRLSIDITILTIYGEVSTNV